MLISYGNYWPYYTSYFVPYILLTSVHKILYILEHLYFGEWKLFKIENLNRFTEGENLCVWSDCKGTIIDDVIGKKPCKC